jgi:hypothetical protein
VTTVSPGSSGVGVGVFGGVFVGVGVSVGAAQPPPTAGTSPGGQGVAVAVGVLVSVGVNVAVGTVQLIVRKSATCSLVVSPSTSFAVVVTGICAVSVPK